MQAVLFDIDNVLIDTRRSYLDAIRWCVDIFLSGGKVPHYQPEKKTRSPHLLSLNDVCNFKLLGGFNDDWDCCYAMLVYLMQLPVKHKTIHALREAKDFAGLVKEIKERPLRMAGISKKFKRHPAITIEKISRIFQEIYLGPDLFEKQEKKAPVYWKKRGLIYMEKLIFKEEIFAKLKNAGIKLGIATGRPRFEAEFVLKRFGVMKYFDAMTTMDEVKKAEAHAGKSLRKPHPYSLLATAKHLNVHEGLLYIGDLPDDMLAAKQGGLKAASFPWYSADSKEAMSEMSKTKPDFLLKKPKHLLKLAGI